MNRYAILGHKDMCAHEGIVLTEVVTVAIDTKNFVGKFSAQRCVGEQVSDASLDIHPAIGLCCAGFITDRIQFGQVLAQVGGQGLQHVAPFVKGHFAQGRVSHFAAVLQYLFKIQSLCAG